MTMVMMMINSFNRLNLIANFFLFYFPTIIKYMSILQVVYKKPCLCFRKRIKQAYLPLIHLPDNQHPSAKNALRRGLL